MNAQIVLWQSGNFVARSNDVETVCCRVNPDGWDDDGIHNERDANPTVCDGDFFGIIEKGSDPSIEDPLYMIRMLADRSFYTIYTFYTADLKISVALHKILV